MHPLKQLYLWKLTGEAVRSTESFTCWFLQTMLLFKAQEQANCCFSTQLATLAEYCTTFRMPKPFSLSFGLLAIAKLAWSGLIGHVTLDCHSSTLDKFWVFRFMGPSRVEKQDIHSLLVAKSPQSLVLAAPTFRSLASASCSPPKWNLSSPINLPAPPRTNLPPPTTSVADVGSKDRLLDCP